jgi:hypothetical protein
MGGPVPLINTGGPVNLGQAFGAGCVNMGHRRSTKSDRNSAIFLAYQAGSTTGQLAEAFGLAILTVRSIIYHERNKREVAELHLAANHASSGQP